MKQKSFLAIIVLGIFWSSFSSADTSVYWDGDYLLARLDGANSEKLFHSLLPRPGVVRSNFRSFGTGDRVFLFYCLNNVERHVNVTPYACQLSINISEKSQDTPVNIENDMMKLSFNKGAERLYNLLNMEEDTTRRRGGSFKVFKTTDGKAEIECLKFVGVGTSYRCDVSLKAPERQ